MMLRIYVNFLPCAGNFQPSKRELRWQNVFGLTFGISSWYNYVTTSSRKEMTSPSTKHLRAQLWFWG